MDFCDKDTCGEVKRETDFLRTNSAISRRGVPGFSPDLVHWKALKNTVQINIWLNKIRPELSDIQRFLPPWSPPLCSASLAWITILAKTTPPLPPPMYRVLPTSHYTRVLPPPLGVLPTFIQPSPGLPPLREAWASMHAIKTLCAIPPPDSRPRLEHQPSAWSLRPLPSLKR
ncbi:hypothetical protein BOTBODRAFT_179086 [Botryobasidium botryosum FD-172 SS1]|uniref:Uncharacterized protein n=1 Tax=Botryobasidium botryosum (strain FD-172 SS1) TaxID=930990 RepID=A0A067M1H4_BOTB1|nr:hypothetical protein BOTBODRAFT_179086 [Botryobasidium botryosum FD-172 SS1]